MDYIITNRKEAIRLDSAGRPCTCNHKAAQRFPEEKARHIKAHLPKTLQRFHFQVERVGEEYTDVPDVDSQMVNVPGESKVIMNTYRAGIPSCVQTWVNKVKSFNGLAKEAEQRKEFLNVKLSDTDKKIENVKHEIEFSQNLNVCDGYSEYKKIRELLRRRREIKDELFIVTLILSSNLSAVSQNQIEKSADRLANRKYTYR